VRRMFAGAVLGISLLLVGCWLYLRLGLANTRADIAPGRLESYLASTALDASVSRAASGLSSPYPESDDNLVDGMNIYVSNCASCHGTLDRRTSDIGVALYPPAPQLILHPLDDSESHVFYVVKHGVRRTGMPAWGEILSDRSLWEVSAFLTRLQKLPPAVQQQMPAPAS
jgi:thiosulfate dehydrogenase